MKNKKPLFITLIALDVAVTIFLFVISIIMLSKVAGMTNKADIDNEPGFIGFLMRNPTIYGLAFVLPLFVLLAVNIIGLVMYVRKSAKKEPVKVNDLSAEQKEALRQELLRDLQAAQPAQPAQEVKKEEPAPAEENKE